VTNYVGQYTLRLELIDDRGQLAGNVAVGVDADIMEKHQQDAVLKALRVLTGHFQKGGQFHA
jgi:hypothetical protein